MATVFLSYSRQDFETDGKRPSGPILTKALDYLEAETKSILGTRERIFWRDTEGLRWGDEWRRRLHEEVANADFLVVLLSPNWLRSEVCIEEYESFRAGVPDAQCRILPIQLRDLPAESTGLDPTARSILDVLEGRQFADWRMLGQLAPNAIAALCEDHAQDLARRIRDLQSPRNTVAGGEPERHSNNAAPDVTRRPPIGMHRKAPSGVLNNARAERASAINLKLAIGAGLAVLVAGVIAMTLLVPNCSISVTNGLASCFGIKARDITITDQPDE